MRDRDSRLARKRRPERRGSAWPPENPEVSPPPEGGFVATPRSFARATGRASRELIRHLLTIALVGQLPSAGVEITRLHTVCKRANIFLVHKSANLPSSEPCVCRIAIILWKFEKRVKTRSKQRRKCCHLESQKKKRKRVDTTFYSNLEQILKVSIDRSELTSTMMERIRLTLQRQMILLTRRFRAKNSIRKGDCSLQINHRQRKVARVRMTRLLLDFSDKISLR